MRMLDGCPTKKQCVRVTRVNYRAAGRLADRAEDR
jgi:hypothetical protein